MSESVQEMKQKGRIRRSISSRTLHAILILVGFIILAASAIGAYLFIDAQSRQYRIRTLQIARTAARLLEYESFDNEMTKVLDTYKVLPDAVQDHMDENYLENFSFIFDNNYWGLIYFFFDLIEDNNAAAIYLAALDKEDNRIVHIVNAHFEKKSDDKTAAYYPPGYWTEITPEEKDAYLNGTQGSKLDSLYDLEPIPVKFTVHPDSGYHCNAAYYIKDISGFPIMVFAEIDLNEIVRIGRTFVTIYVIIILILTAGAALIMNHWSRKRIVIPINKLASAADAYAKAKQLGNPPVSHFENLDIHTGDEIENLSLTMESMEKDLSVYEKDLTRAAAEQERIKTEMNAAAHIQVGMLPHDFAAINENPCFSLYASMQPARDVGGDFYDFFLVDDTHLALVMADVSGKGFPAALFMMHSMTLIRSAVLAGDSPSEALTKVNRQLIEGNEADMFVTVWLAVIDLENGKGLAANAGHEHPALKRSGGSYELIRYRHSPVIGSLDGIRISEHSFEINPGDSIFVYTDGVTEATSADNELFGTDRMLEALNEAPEAAPEQTLQNVISGIKRFVNGAEQFDDITMLCFHFRSFSGSGGKNESSKSS